MVSPRIDNFSTPETLTLDELTEAAEFVKKFVNSGRRVAGFNISQEPRKRRDQIQSWANFHIHCVHFPSAEGLAPIFAIPDRQREKLRSLTGKLLIELVAPVVKPEEGTLAACAFSSAIASVSGRGR